MKEEMDFSGAAQLEEVLGELERLEQERELLSEQIREVFDRAREAGLNKDILREMIEIRKEQKKTQNFETAHLYLRLLKWKGA